MRFLNPLIVKVGTVFLAIGIGFNGLATNNAIGQISQSGGTNPPETMKPMTSLENTSWKLLKLGESQLLAEKPITLNFSKNNRLAGSSGCNRYFGTFSVQNKQFSIPSPLGATRMACPETIMNRENEFLKALTAAKSYQINAQGELEIEYSVGEQTQLLLFSLVP